MSKKVFFSCSDPDGVSNIYDIGQSFVKKSDLIENYPWMVNSQMGGSTLFLWGTNCWGVLGNNSTINLSSPVQTITAGTDWRSVSVGGSYNPGSTLAIKTNGTLWGWGNNCFGDLADNTTISRSSPVQTISGGTNWKQASNAGESGATAGAVKTDGTLWTWGFEGWGTLGNNLAGNVRRSSPIQTISGGTNWKNFCKAGRSAAALKNDGTLWGWGCNSAGNLGDNSTTARSSPVQTVSGGTDWRFVSAGTRDRTRGAIKTNGTLWMWGCGLRGTLGDSATLDKSSPVQVSGLNTNWKSLAVGTFDSLAIKTDGVLYGWGFGGRARLTAIQQNYSTYVPTKSTFDQRFKTVSVSAYTAAGITETGQLFIWGSNVLGQFGNNSASACAYYGSPSQTLSGGNNWRSVDITLWGHIAAIRDIDDE